MKKNLRSFVSILLAVLMLASFSSCSVFKRMRENVDAVNNFEQNARMSPEKKEDVVKLLLDSIDYSITIAPVNVSVSYSVGDVKIYKEGAPDENLGLLSKSAKTLKSLIMDNNPGAESYEMKDSENALFAFGVDCVATAKTERNTKSEAVTNEKGDEIFENETTEVYVNVTDENGEELSGGETTKVFEDVTDDFGEIVTRAKTVEKRTDDILHITLECYKEISQPAEKSSGTGAEEAEEEETVVYYEYPCDSAKLEQVFDKEKDHAEVIANFDCISDYAKINGYEIEYGKYTITADTDIASYKVDFVTFTKEMTVYAHVTGQGSLAEYGDFTVELKLTKVTTYSFSHVIDDTADDYIDDTFPAIIYETTDPDAELETLPETPSEVTTEAFSEDENTSVTEDASEEETAETTEDEEVPATAAEGN